MSLTQTIPGESRHLFIREFKFSEATVHGEFELEYGSKIYLARSPQGWYIGTRNTANKMQIMVLSHEGAELIAAAILDTREPNRPLVRAELVPYRHTF